MIKNGYTFVELLLVVAIIAAIGSGVAAYYGKELIMSAKEQLTLREMAEIKRAFLSFHADNSARLLDGIHDAEEDTYLPTDRFCSTFKDDDRPTAYTVEQPNRLYGMIEFYERYGLWELLRPEINWPNQQKAEEFIVFGPYSPDTASGWRGPYLDALKTIPCTLAKDGMLMRDDPSRRDVSSSVNKTKPVFTQIATRYDNRTNCIYRIVYFEHRRNEDDVREPIYRRLILYASTGVRSYQSWNEMKTLTGNRRGGDDSGYPLNPKTGEVTSIDREHGLYFLELLNFDKVPEVAD